MKERTSTNPSLAEALERSEDLRKDIVAAPHRHRVLTGDRPTGPLHIGHLFGTLLSRVELQNIGVETFIVIADYQVLTDRDAVGAISTNVGEVVLDYLAAGLDLLGDRTHVFAHSAVPELNQLLLPFLSLMSMTELDRNPTMKQEIADAGLRVVNALMYVYPVHQAADILSVGGTVVPVGPDQLPHLEVARDIARRFNLRFGNSSAVFVQPEALLSSESSVSGLDGAGKMSKSRGNAIFLRMSEDQTAAVIKAARTDSERLITYEPDRRPEVSAMLQLASLCTGRKPDELADSLGSHGAGGLKSLLTEAVNEYLRPIRQRRADFAADPTIVGRALSKGVSVARPVASASLERVRRAMGTRYCDYE